jgi:hypothetical protein
MPNVTVSPFQLMQWKAWLRMEINVGGTCRHSSGRSVRKRAALAFGLRPRADREQILDHIESALAACLESGVSPLDTVTLANWADRNN